MNQKHLTLQDLAIQELFAYSTGLPTANSDLLCELYSSPVTVQAMPVTVRLPDYASRVIERLAKSYRKFGDIEPELLGIFAGVQTGFDPSVSTITALVSGVFMGEREDLFHLRHGREGSSPAYPVIGINTQLAQVHFSAETLKRLGIIQPGPQI